MVRSKLLQQLAIELLLVLISGLILGLFGPFGTYATAAPSRFAYWMGFGLVAYAIFRPLILSGKWLSDALKVPHFLGVGLALFVAAMPMSLLIATLISKFDVAAALQWSGLAQLYFQVWLIGFISHAVFSTMFRSRNENSAQRKPDAETSADVEIAFLSRLPVGFGPLLALQSEDHYVRAIGAMREELVLIRLRDAIAELAGVEGLQVHRSWWVAKAAIAQIKRDGRGAVIILTSGAEVSVARNKMAELRALNWI